MKTRIKWNKFNDLEFNEKNHTYKVDNQYLESCTRFIKKFEIDIFTEEFIEKYCKKYNFEKKHIKELWDIKTKVGKVKGTELHQYIEHFFIYNIKNEVSLLNIKEVEYFHNFLKDYSFLKTAQVEYPVYDLDLGIAGTLDYLSIDEQGRYWLIDWKTNKNISKYSKTKFKEPINYLQQSDYNIYSIQLNIYKHILEKHLGITIYRMMLVHLNSTNKNYKVFDIDEKNATIKRLFN